MITHDKRLTLSLYHIISPLGDDDDKVSKGGDGIIIKMVQEIPKQLQDKRFRFIKLKPKQKLPLELCWQVNDVTYFRNSKNVWINTFDQKPVEVKGDSIPKHKPADLLCENGKYYYVGKEHSYEYNNPNLKSFMDKGGCVALLCGVGGVVVTDVDQSQYKEPTLNALPKTFTGLSGTKKLPHFYYLVDESFKKYPIKDEKKKTKMDILGLGSYVVCPLSKVDKDCEYKILNDVPITKIPLKQLKAILYQFETKPIIKKEYESSGSNFIEELVSKVKIEDVLNNLGIDTTKNPTNCPLHDSVAGKCLGFDENVAHCFNCEESFNIISLIKKAKKLESLEAIDYLANLGGLQDEREKDKEQWFKENIQVENTQEKIKEAKPLQLWGVSDYRKHKPCKHFIIKGYKRPNESEMLSAPSTAGKSILAMNQAVCIASGRKWLGKFKTKKCAVLFVSAETSNDWVKEKLEWTMRGMRIRSSRIPLYFLPRNQCEDLMNPQFAARICKSIEEKNIKVIYLDTANPLTPSLDDNSAKDVTRLFNEFLKPIIDKYGVNITFLAHTDKKGNDYLGSMKWFANVDCSCRLDRKGLDNKITLFNEKNRSGEVNTLDIEINFDNEKKTIIMGLLSEREAQRFSKKKKMTQQEFFILKLNKLIGDKNTERKDIHDIFKENDINFSVPTLDRALKVWRVEK